MNRNRKRLFSLVNYEGDVLKMKKVDDDEYVIYDQWDSIVDIVTTQKLLEFLDGASKLQDSEGNQWYWPNIHREARTTLYQIFNYMKEPVE